MLTADDVLAAVRVHADRLHDAVRRLGCGPEVAAHVVETASLDLVDTVARSRGDVQDPVGWLFARGRALARGAAGGEDDALPLGGGVLGGDATQVRLAEALESRPERERSALLLRDSYDLPMPAVAAALALDVTAATEAVGAARLALLPGLTDAVAPRVPDHVPLTSLTRLAEGGQHAARESTAFRHTQSCERCAAVVDAQERARRLLSGLTVVALPDAEREDLLDRVAARAASVLPAAVPGTQEEVWEEEPRRRYSLSLMALGLVLALGAGVGIGVLTSRGGSGAKVADQKPLPLVTAAPVLTVGTLPTGTASPTPPPSPRVFYVTPSPTPTPSATPTPTASTSTQAALQLDPATGPGGSQFTVTGAGWLPGAQVTIQYLNANGTTSSTQQVVTDPQGTFTTTLTASGTSLVNPAGPHTVTASDGSQQAQATFTAT